MDQLEGRLQIPGIINTSRLAVRWAVDYLYVQRMHRYLDGSTENLAVPHCLILAEVVTLKRHTGKEYPPYSLQARSWYRHAIMLDRRFENADLEVFRENRSADASE